MAKTTIESEVVKGIREQLGLKPKVTKKKAVNESYVTVAKKYNLATEFLSAKNKKSSQEDFEKHVEALNEISAQLDTASRDDAHHLSSDFRRLKVDEVHCLNAAFLRALHFENISDVRSQLTMDSISFMRLERDFGSFDDWQRDFIACAMSSRNGYALTAYNVFLKRYVNFVVDNEASNVPIGSIPIIVLDVSEGSYYRDYLNDRKTYVVAMMKEFDWEKINERFKRSEKIAKVMA